MRATNRDDRLDDLENKLACHKRWADELVPHLRTMQRATGVALAQLLRMQEHAAPDCNSELWDYFDQLGGDCDKLMASIQFTKQIRSDKAGGDE